MKIKIVLALSVILNFILAVNLYIKDIQNFQNIESVDLPVQADKQDISPLDYLKAGISNRPIDQDDVNKITFLALLQYQSERSLPDDSPAYWETLHSIDRSSIGHQIAVEDNIRQALIERYGLSATEDPVFSKYFFPLGSGLDFLSSEKQIKLSEINLRRNFKLANLAANVESYERAQSDYFNEAKVLLTPEEFFEFQLRKSTIASRIKTSSINFTEEEFRTVFRLLTEGELQKNRYAVLSDGLNNNNLYDKRISGMLGKDRYFELLHVLDANFRLLQSVASKHSIKEPDIIEAYEVIVNANEEIREISRSTESTSYRVQEIADSRNVRLSQILGPKAWDSLSLFFGKADPASNGRLNNLFSNGYNSGAAH